MATGSGMGTRKTGTRKHLFKPGQSGNPAGRPKGTFSRPKLIDILKENAPTIVSKCIQMALDGDKVAIKLCMDKLIPNKLSNDIHLDNHRDLNEFRNLLETSAELCKKMLTGEVSPNDASHVGSVLDMHKRMLESLETDKRVKEIEDKIKGL